MSEENKETPPERRFTLSLKIGGDTIIDVEVLARHFLAEMHDGREKMVSGGCDSGGWFELKENPDMTSELYAQKLEEFLAARSSSCSS